MNRRKKLLTRNPIKPAPTPADVAEEAERQGVDPVLAVAVALAESQGNPNARSSAGALSTMQVMPETGRRRAKELGEKYDPTDPHQNVRLGVRELRDATDQFETTDEAVAAYNAGAGAVKRHRGIPPYKETREYVPRVRKNYEQIQRRISGLGDVFAIADSQGQETAATGAQTDDRRMLPETASGNIVNLGQAQQRLAQNEMRALSRTQPSSGVPDTFRRDMTNEPTIQDFAPSAPNVLSRKPATTRRIVRSAQPGQNATGLGESDEPRLMPSADDVEQVSPDMRALGETGARSLNQRFSEKTNVRRLTLPSGLGRAITTANDVEAQTLAKDAFVKSHQGQDREAATFLSQFVVDGFFDKRPQPQFNGKDGSYTLELAEPAWWSRALEAYRQGGKEQALAQVRDDATRLDEIERSRVEAEQGVKNEQARLKNLENTGVLQGGQYGEGLAGGLQAAAQGALSGTQDAIAAVAGLPGQVEALFSDNYYNPENDNAVARLFRGAAARTGGAASGEATPNAGVLRRYAGAGGSMVPYLTTGLATGGSSLAVGALGAAQNASALQREAIVAGGTPDQIRTAYGAGAAVGSLEGALGFKGEAPIARAGLRAGAKEVGKQFVEESGQEGISQGLNNVVASDVAGYDRKRKWHQGVLESMIVGGVLGGGMTAGMVGAQAIADRWTPEQAETVGRIIERSGMQAEQVAAAPPAVQKTIIDQTRAMMAFEADYETLMQQLQRERAVAEAGQQRAASGFVPTPIEDQAGVKAQQLEQQSAELLQQARITQDNLNQIGAQLAFESQRLMAEQQAQQAQQTPAAVAPESSEVLSAQPTSDEVVETQQQPAPVSQPAPVASSLQEKAPSELLSDLADERTAAIRGENQIAPGQGDEVTSLIEKPVDLFAEVRQAGGLEQTKDLAGELGQFGAKELGTTGLVRGSGKGLKTDTLRGDLKSEGKSQAENVDDFLQELEAEKRYRRFRRVNDQWSDKAWKEHVEKWAEDEGDFERLTTQLAKYPELESRVLEAYEEGLTSDEYERLYEQVETGLGRDDASRLLHYLINRGAGFRKADQSASSSDAEYDGRSGRSGSADGGTDAGTADGQELTTVRSNPIPEWMRGRDIYKMSGKDLTEFILDLRAERAQMIVAVQGDVDPGLRSTVNEILDAAVKRRNEMKARQSALKKAKQTVPENEVVPAFDEKRTGGTKTGKKGLAQKLIEAQQQQGNDDVRSTDVQPAPVVEAGQNDAGDVAKLPDNNDGQQAGAISVSDANVSPSNNSESQDVAPDESLAPIGRVRPDEITILKSARDYRVHLPFGHDAFLRANRSKLGAFDPKTETWPVAKGRVEQIADAIAYWFGLPVRVEGRDAVWTPPADSPALRSRSESDYPKMIRDNQEAFDRLGEISLLSDEAGTLLDQIYEYTVVNGIAKRHYDALVRTLMQMHKNEAQQLDDKERYDERKAINEAAHEAATSPQNDLPEPTQGQKEAGNYKKGHILWNGLDLSIENPKGSERSGVDADGEKWSVTMSAHYGYIKRTEGADGEHVDIYMGNKPESDRVFVIDQNETPSGKFDEHKVVFGVATQAEAEKLYDAHFSDGKGPQRRAAVTEMSVDEFKAWLKDGDLKKPFVRDDQNTAITREISPGIKTLFHAKRAVGDVKEGPSFGVFFTEDEAIAKKYAGKTGSYAAYDVTVKKPMLLTADDSAGADYASAAHVNSQLEKAGVDYKFDQYDDQELWRYFDDGGTDFIKAVKRAGYDSIAYTDAFGAKPFNSWLVFDKKSAQTPKSAEAPKDEKRPEISPLNQIRQRLSPHALRVLNHIDGNGATTLSNVNYALMMTNAISKPALQELVDAGVITNNEGVFRYKDAAKTFQPAGDYRENLFTARIYANALAIDTKGKEHKQLIAEIEDRLKLANQPVSTTPKSDAAASLRQALVSALNDAKEKGVELRVKDLGQTMRVNLDNKTRKEVGAIIEEALNELGYTSASGQKLQWSNWNGSNELNAYKPGVVQRVDEAKPAAEPEKQPTGKTNFASLFANSIAELEAEEAASSAPVEKPTKPAKSAKPATKKAATPKEKKPAKPRTAGGAAKDAVIETAQGLSDVFEGLAKLIGDDRSMSSGGFAMDEKTYQAAKPYFIKASQHFMSAKVSAQEAMTLFLRALRDEAKFTIAMMKKLEPLIIRFMEEQEAGLNADESPTTAAAKPDDQPTSLLDIAEKPKSEFERVSDVVYDELKAGRKLDNPKLRTIADKIYGGTQMSGKYQMKDAYDAVEMAVNRIISESADIYMAAGVKPLNVFTKLRNLMAQLPTQASDMRTAEQQKLQQFSTPPQLAFLAAKVLNPTAADVVVEPSAGTGSLAVFARGAGAKVYANEISERRRNALRALDFETSGVDAEFLHSLLPKHIQPSAVIMNPPFSSTGERGLTNSSKFGARHVREALLRLKDGGRLVAIVSDGMGLDKPRMASWWAEILDNYTVKADVSISGQEYAKYGTTYDNRVLVIDKTGPTPGNATAFQIAHVLRGRYEKIEDAYEALQTIADERKPANVEQPATNETNSDTAESGNNVESNAGQTDGRDRGASSGTGGGSVGTRSGRSGRGSSSSGATRSGRSGGKLPKGKSGVAGQENQQQENRSRNADNEQPGPVEFGVNPAALERQQDESGTFITYQPAKIIGGAPHPAIIVEAASMGAIDPPDPTYQPNLPQSTLENGISNVQVESVVYAGQRHELRMRNGARAGFFIGDGTGVGKGRQISAVILDNWRQGRRRAVWFSTGQQLAESAERDLKGVGAGHLPLYIIHDAAAGEEIKFGDGVLFATYSMIAKQAGEGKMTRLEQIEKWLGDDGVIVFDEGHKAKNAVSGQQGGEGTQTGEAVVSIQNDLPNARVVYASATGATDVRNMAYMERLGLWGVGTPFPGGFADFWREVEGGGYGAMEMVARDMKALGAYLSRSISFGVDPESGLAVEYRKQVHELTPNQEDVYDGAAEAWQEVLKNIDTALEQTNGGKRQKARAMAQFYGAQQRFFKSLITAAKVPTAIELANKALAEGKQVVISIIGTGETAQKKQVAGAKASGIDLEDLDFSPRQTLLDYIDRSFPVLQYVQVKDPATGVITTTLLTDEHGNPVENAEAVAMRNELKQKLAGLRLPESPLDQLVNYFEETAGGVAELTGRKKRLMRDPKTGKLELIKRAPVLANKINEYEMGQFQSGKKRVAIISQAAAEGISLHAEKSAPSRDARRVQITLELDWSADKQMQTFGRTHRTNQTMPPEFVLLASNIGGEARFIATIARRLASLGALTKGQRDAAGGGSDFADFNYESPIGEGATTYTLENLHRNQVPGIPDGPQMLEKMGMLDGGGQIKRDYLTDVTAFLNRILALPLKKQNLVFENFATAFQRIVERQKEQGTFDAGVTDIRAVSVKRSSEPVEIAKEPISGAKTYANELELELPTYPVSFSIANRHAVDPTTESSFARYKGKTERLVLVRKATARTDKQTGAIVEQVSLTSPAEDRFTYIDKSKLEENWELITPDEARAQWEEQFSQVPATETHKTYVMSGALLPIWQILRGDKATRLSIVRVPFENGERLVGVRLSVPQARRVMRALGLQSQKRTPQEIYDAVKAGESVVLMGGNRLVLKRFRGEPVIQVLTGDAYMNRRPFLEMGLIENRNFSSSEYYVPNDAEKGVEVLDRLLGSYPEIIQTGTKASELPAASRRVSQVGNVTEIIANAALTIKEPSGSRPARLYGNDHFMAILRRAVTRLYGRDYGNASALTLSGQHLNAVAQYLEQQAQAEGMPALLGEKLTDLAGQLYQTVTDFPQTAYAAVDASFINDDNLFTRSESKERFKQDVREEQFHWSQRAVGGNTIALTGASWAAKKLPKKIAQKLIEAGYANDPELLVAEIAAHIAAGNFAELGVFTDGKKLKAYEWLAEYFARVAEVHGQQALAQFKHLPRDAAQAKTSGAQIYAERVIERSRSGNRDSAKPRTTSDGAGRSGGDLLVVERRQNEILSADEKSAWGNRPIPTGNTAERQNPLGDALLPVTDESFNARPVPTAGISERQQPLGDARMPVTDESFNARPIPTAGISERQQPLGDARMPVTDESFNARPIPTADQSEAKQPHLLPPSLRSSSSREAAEGLVPISDREIQRWRKQVKLAMGSLAQQGRIDKEMQNKIWDLIERAETAIERNDGARLVQIRQETVKLLQSRPTVRGRLLDVLNLPKALKASFDLSYPFRQGAIATLNTRNLFNGRMGDRSREWKAMLLSLSKGKSDEIQAELRNHPLYDFAEEVGLHLVSREALSIGATSAQKEESFASNLAEKIPGIQASERAYTAAADMQRIQMFSTFVTELERAGISFEDDAKAYQDVAGFVNNITGRGELPKALDSLAPLLNTLMFSPRYLASRVRVMNPVYYAQMSPAARKLAMKEMAGFFMMLALVMTGAAMAGASVGLDPDEADFLKIKIGNTRYDLLAGLQQLGVFAFRVIKRMALHAVGKEPKQKYKTTIGEIARRFARSKASPVAGYFYDWFVTHKTFLGKPFEHGKAEADLLVPIMWNDFYEAAKTEGWLGVVKTAPSIVGVGVNTYKPSVKVKSAKPKLSPTAQARRELLRR